MTILKEYFNISKENNTNYLRVDKSGNGVAGIVCYATAYRHYKFMRKSVLVGKVGLVLFDYQNKEYRHKLIVHQGNIIKCHVGTNEPASQMFVIDDYVEFIGDSHMVWRIKFDTSEERDGFLCSYKQRGGCVALFSDDPDLVNDEGEEDKRCQKNEDRPVDNEVIVLQKKLLKMEITASQVRMRPVKVYRLYRHRTPLHSGK